MANIPISSFTAAANATGIGMSGFSLTGSNAQSMLDLAGTWNTTGTPTGLKLNVTDTASNAASLLMDLQVGGSSRLSLRKDGLMQGAGPASGAFVIGSTTLFRPGAIAIGQNTGAFPHVSSNGGGQLSSDALGAVNTCGWNNGGFLVSSVSSFGWTSGSLSTNIDTALYRDAANTLAQRNGVNAQTFRVYNTFTDASNYERGFVQYSGNVLQIGHEALGTGIAGRSLALLAGGTNYFSVGGGSGVWLVNTSGNLVCTADNTRDIGASGANRPRNIFAAGDIYTQSNTTGFYLGSAADVALLRDTANTLAQRRGTNAQAFRVYNTYTDASNGEWLGIRWSTNDMLIGVQANGTGSTNRQMHFSASSFRFFVGSGAVTRAWDILADTSLSYEGTGSGHITMKEQTAPAAPATNAVRIYAEDNGSGKTRLMALFATGVAQQIAIEP